MILLRPRSSFATQKRRRGLSVPVTVRKIARPERDANLEGRSLLVEALAPIFEENFQRFRTDVDDSFRRQRLDGRGRLSLPVNAIDLNDRRFGGMMEDAMLAGISVGGDIGIRHTGVEGIDLDRNLVTERARNWVRSEGTRRIVEINRGNQRNIRRSVHEALRANLSPTAAANRISREIGLTGQQSATLRNFEASLLRQRIPTPEADTQLVRETIAQDIENRRGRMINERSRTILQTEMQTAIQTGERQFYEEAAAEGQIDADFLEKRWFTVLDDRVCAICEPLHGTVIAFNESFSSGRFNGLNPPAHPNCRCFLEYKPDGEFGGQDDEGGPELLGPGEQRQIQPSRTQRFIEGAEDVLGFLETVEPIPDGFRFTSLPNIPLLPSSVSITIAEPLRPSFLRPVFTPRPRVRRAIEVAGRIRDFRADPRGVIAGEVIERLPEDIVRAIGVAQRAIGVARDPRGAISQAVLGALPPEIVRAIQIAQDPRGAAREAARAAGARVRAAAIEEAQALALTVARRVLDDFSNRPRRTQPAEVIAIPEAITTAIPLVRDPETGIFVAVERRRNLSKQRPRTRGRQSRERRRRFGSY